jgi:hypothetical protein
MKEVPLLPMLFTVAEGVVAVVVLVEAADVTHPVNKRPTCQVCKKKGHTANLCWHRYDEEYVPEERVTIAATGGQGHDGNWYTDSGTTDHVTCDLEKLATRDKYTGNDQIHTASSSGMHISHIGISAIHTPCRQLQLNKILHVQHTSKSLISVHRLASDNNVFLVSPSFLLYQGFGFGEHTS